MRTSIRIVFVIFIANRIDCLGGVCDDCCDCFKDKDENITAESLLVNNDWYKYKKGNKPVLKIFGEKNNNVFTYTENQEEILLKLDENNKLKITDQNENEPKSEDPLNLEDKKYALFKIKTNTNKTVYLYCSDVESFENENTVYGIFLNMDHISISVIACDTENVRNMACMFYECSSLTELKFGKDFNTSNVRDMKGMFSGCKSLTELKLENFDTKNVLNMWRMFTLCCNLTKLDLEKFNTTNVTNMGSMFFECSNLTELKFGEDFNTSNVTNMYSMFYECSSLTKLDLTNFNTTSVTDMQKMFYKCSSLTYLKLGQNFESAKVTNKNNMFYECDSFPNEIQNKLNNVDEIDEIIAYFK